MERSGARVSRPDRPISVGSTHTSHLETLDAVHIELGIDDAALFTRLHGAGTQLERGQSPRGQALAAVKHSLNASPFALHHDDRDQNASQQTD